MSTFPSFSYCSVQMRIVAARRILGLSLVRLICIGPYYIWITVVTATSPRGGWETSPQLAITRHIVYCFAFLEPTLDAVITSMLDRRFRRVAITIIKSVFRIGTGCSKNAISPSNNNDRNRGSSVKETQMAWARRFDEPRRSSNDLLWTIVNYYFIFDNSKMQ